MNQISDAVLSRKPFPTNVDVMLLRFARRHRLPPRVAAVVAELAGIALHWEARHG